MSLKSDLEKIKNSSIFEQMSLNIAKDLENLEKTKVSQDNLEEIQNILALYFLDENGNNICDCINKLNSNIEKLLLKLT